MTTKTATGRNGSVHTLSYDVLGRVTTDAVTTLGSGVDGSIRRIESWYGYCGRLVATTSYDSAYPCMTLVVWFCWAYCFR